MTFHHPGKDVVVHPRLAAAPAGPYIDDEVELVLETFDRVGVPQGVVAERVDPPKLGPVQGGGLYPAVARGVEIREVEGNVAHRIHNAIGCPSPTSKACNPPGV